MRRGGRGECGFCCSFVGWAGARGKGWPGWGAWLRRGFDLAEKGLLQAAKHPTKEVGRWEWAVGLRRRGGLGKIGRFVRLVCGTRERVPFRMQRLRRATKGYSSCFLLRGRVLNQMGVPMKLKAARIWLARKRSKAKWSLTSRSVKRTKVGGATAAWVM